MKRLAFLLPLLAACSLEGFPPDNQPTAPAREPQALAAPRELVGTLVSNWTSGMVVATDEGHLELEIGPGTYVGIGDVEVGARAVQAGSEVRATWLPGAASGANLALEVVAVPGTGGWEHDHGGDARGHPAVGD